MVPPEPETLVQNAERIYQQQLKAQLEATQRGRFLAIEPVSGDYFLGPTLSEAIGAARAAHPERRAYALRIGHATAVEIGELSFLSGTVDAEGRAFVRITVLHPTSRARAELDAWVDTAFTGELFLTPTSRSRRRRRRAARAIPLV